MKRILFVLALALSLSASAQAYETWLSSTTATADSQKVLCGSGQRAIIHGVCTSTGAAGGVTVYNSSFTTSTNLIGPLDTTAKDSCQMYDASFPKGMIYTKTGTATSVLLYKCY